MAVEETVRPPPPGAVGAGSVVQLTEILQARRDRPMVILLQPAAPVRQPGCRRTVAARHDPREVVTDSHALYFGAGLSEGSLVPVGDAILAETRYSDWPGRTVVGR
jgi:hypothetical protein